MHSVPDDIAVDVIDHLPAARDRWKALETTGAATPFQSFAWVSTLAETVGRSQNADTFVIIVCDGAGRDLMLLPLVRRSYGPVRMIEMPDFGVSDYVSPVIAPEVMSQPAHLGAIWQAALTALPRADAIRFSRIPQDLGLQPNPMLGLVRTWTKDTQSWRVSLPEQWSQYETRVLSTKVRGDLRRRLKNLEQSNAVEYLSAQNAPAAHAIFDALCAHREARFTKLGRRNILDDPSYREFYWQVIKNGISSGLVSLSALKMGSDIVATLLGLRWRDGYVALIPTMSESDALQKHGIGKLMNWFQIREMHASGCRSFDFSIGDEPYKRDFGATPRTLHEMVIPLKLQASPLAWTFELRAGLKRWRKKPAAIQIKA